MAARNTAASSTCPSAKSFAARLAAQAGEYDGIGKNLTSGKDIANQDLWSARLSLRWDASENFQNLTVLDYFDSKDNGSLNVLAGLVPCTTNPTAAGINQFLTGTPPASCLYSSQVNAALGRGDLPAALATQDARGPYTVAYDNPTFEDAQARNASNATTINLSDALLIKNIIGYHDVELLTQTDLDGANIKVIDTYLDSQVDQWSEELQLQGEYDRFNFVVGGLYFKEEGTDIQISTQLSGFNPTNPNYLNTTGTNTSYAVFAQGTYKLLDNLSMTAGGRYTWDKREVFYDNPTSRYGQPTSVCQFSAAIAPGCVLDLEKDFSDPSYTFSLEYKLAEEILMYVATRQGYRSGGFNARAVNAVQLEPFDPETVTDVEVGFKRSI